MLSYPIYGYVCLPRLPFLCVFHSFVPRFLAVLSLRQGNLDHLGPAESRALLGEKRTAVTKEAWARVDLFGRLWQAMK